MKTKKIFSLLLALVMMVGVFAPSVALATGVSTEPDAVTKTVILHKLMLEKNELAGWEHPPTYDGTQNKEALQLLVQGITLKEVANVYFAFKYKSGTNDGKFVTIKVTPGTGGNPDEYEYGAADSLDATLDTGWDFLAGLTTTDGITFQTSGLAGNFEIVEVYEKSTYVGADGETITDSKAVPVEITLPLVNNNGTVLNAHVYPKNTEEKPKIDKDFAEANDNTGANPTTPGTKETKDHQIGDVINYDIKTVIPAKAKYATAVWDDKMTEGLTLNQDSIAVTVDGQPLAATAYSLAFPNNGFILSLNDDGLAAINNKDTEVTVKITYSATLNKNAVVDVPESNDVMFHYGNNPGHGNTPIPTKPNENGELKVTKTMTGVDWPAEGISVQLVNANTGANVGDPVTLTETNSTYTWTDLDKDTEYKVVELTAGYQVTYGLGETAGNITIENEKSENPNPLNPDEPKVITYGKKFVKTNDEDKTTAKRLAGAEFYVKNSEGNYLAPKSGDVMAAEAQAVIAAKTALDDAITAYNALSAEEQAAPDQDPALSALALINEKQEAYNQAVFNAGDVYEWVTDKTKAIVLVSDAEGRFEIKGLKAGTYKLEEKTPPAGYAAIPDQEFTVGAGTYAGTADEMQYNPDDTTAGYGQQVRNKKVTIPQTGGIGTVIFAVGGLALMGGAAFAMKKNKEEDEE